MHLSAAASLFGSFALLINVAHSSPICDVKAPLRVETFVNKGPSLDVVSSLVIGSEAAVLIDMPLAIPQANELAQWIENTTDKPLVAAFTTHFHPDHYLSGGATLSQFPGAIFYASNNTVGWVQNEVSKKVDFWSGILGKEAIVQEPLLPQPYDFTFFTLPGDEDSPIIFLDPVGGDTVDETMFYIPTLSTLITGDVVYGREMHPWLADLLNPALTASWLSSLDFIDSLNVKKIIPGHAVTNTAFDATKDLNHTRDYVQYFQSNIESKGQDFFSPLEIFDSLNAAFPGLLNLNNSTASATILNITGEQFGRGGSRLVNFLNLASFSNVTSLTGWHL